MSFFYHIVLLKLRDSTPVDFHQRVHDFCACVRRSCDNVLSFEYLPNEAARSGGYDYAVVARFGSSVDHEAYQVHPVHVDMKAFMSPYIEELCVLDTTSTAEFDNPQAAPALRSMQD